MGWIAVLSQTCFVTLDHLLARSVPPFLSFVKQRG